MGATVTGGAGDDELLGARGDDFLLGGAGADVLSGGEGRDQAAYYEHTEALILTIGDGANDGAAGEGDDIRADVEEVGGGDGPDLLVGDDGPNGLSGGPGRDTLRGLGGADRLLGLGDGDLLDPGSGADHVRAGGHDTLELIDGEPDFVRCGGTGPAIQADDSDSLRSCAPRVWLRTRGFDRRGVTRVFVRCDPRSTVPCSGRLSLWLGGRRVSRVARFGPVRPGTRDPHPVTLLARRLPRPGGRCLGVRAITVRDDVKTQTLAKGASCRRLPARASG
jgi:RTX calcium-binding nonapeptide repeat (4 copies)